MVKRKIGVHFIIINSIRLLLIISFFLALLNLRRLVLIMSLIGFVGTFFPYFLERYFKLESPVSIEILFVLFLYGILFSAEVQGVFRNFWWWSLLLNIFASVALGLVALSVVFVLRKEKIIETSVIVASIFVFCLAFATAGIWEMVEFLFDLLVKSNLQKSLLDTMSDLIVNFFGAIIMSIFGYWQMKKGREDFSSSFISGLVRRNWKVLARKDLLEEPSKKIIGFIAKGESDKLEFKSSLRYNLHTSSIDKNIEKSVLKTIVAYLNSKGGSLLVGVNDSGDVLGLDKDGFESNDALGLHLNNMIKNSIGIEFMPFIHFAIYPVDDKHVLKIDCVKSDKPVFLKIGDDEEFYVRSGASSQKLNGRSLLEYIKNNF